MLGQVDLDSFVDSHVTTAQEFEENYKAVRARRREAEKLPEVVKVHRIASRLPEFCAMFVAATKKSSGNWKEFVHVLLMRTSGTRQSPSPSVHLVYLFLFPELIHPRVGSDWGYFQTLR